MALPLKKRWEIVFLNSHEKGPLMSQYKISKYMGLPKSTVNKWLKRYKETGDVQELEGRGRKKIINAEMEKKILELFEKNENLSLKKAQLLLRRSNIEVSISTLSRTLKQLGFKFRSPLVKPVLTPSHIKKRIEWCEKFQEMNWDNVVFTDETTFNLNPYKQKYWSRGRRIKFIRRFRHPQKIHLWGCFSSRGFGTLYLFKDNLTAKKMVEIYKKALLRSINKFGFVDNDDWLLQEDKDPKHTAKLSKKWKSENNIQQIPWPANSPDLSPIENLWSILKMKINEKQPSSIKSLVTIILKTWKDFPIELAQKLVDSMYDRIYDCLEAKGNPILY